ncbi:AAA family ATPase [Terrabacter sp. NPDC000476]|uniref:KGGVGR-motif variant AAA ATPase n=1 Tax=Terrabacter sp. NPDC000476 TaxID=3154258 RepID=UPI00332B6FF9
MTVNFPVPDRLFTWVDVDDHLSKAARAGVLPGWLLEASAYWDSLELRVKAGFDPQEVSNWVESMFGPGSTGGDSEAGMTLRLDRVSDGSGERSLAVDVVEVEDVPDLARVPRWQDTRIVGDLSSPLPRPSGELPEGVNVVAFYSFKGGVGRTLHAVALAEKLAASQKVLIVDADMEAPGVTWMYSTRREIDFAYEDFLALLHASPAGSADDAVEMAIGLLPNQLEENIYVMPCRRNMRELSTPRLSPLDLQGPGQSPYYLTDAIALLAARLGVQTVIVDLRAGVSELSSPLLLDPRIQRVVVTTTNAQSGSGTALVLQEIQRRAPQERSDPRPWLVVTQYRATDDPDAVAQFASPLIEVMEATASVGAEDGGSGTHEVRAGLLLSEFQDSLLSLPSAWSDVLSSVRRAGLPDLVSDLAADFILAADHTPATLRGNISEIVAARSRLASYAKTLAFAETTEAQDFLSTESLRQLVMAHRTEVPIAVIAGAKGAGKTFTQLQMCYRETWAKYGNATGISDVKLDARLTPVLTSRNVTEGIERRVDGIRRSGAVGFDVPMTMLDIRTEIQEGVEADLTELQWRTKWLSFLVRSMGMTLDGSAPEKVLTSLSGSTRRIFLIDGLEDILQDIASNPRQQRALRVLLLDCLEWLRSVRGRPFGLIVFVRIDLVRASVLQNAAQLLARYGEFALNWDPAEAVRLALWVSRESTALPIDAGSVTTEAEDRVTELMKPVWGDKMGTEKSREARSHTWFVAALSDFNGNIQPRDVVTFMSEAAEKSVSDVRWSDRILAPTAMRDALVAVSEQKITAISEESPQIGTLLTKLKRLDEPLRQVPFTLDSVSMSLEEAELLTSSGVIFREEDRFWIPEIFRHGLGFRATGRPRVLAIANLVRRRNNID